MKKEEENNNSISQKLYAEYLLCETSNANVPCDAGAFY